MYLDNKEICWTFNMCCIVCVLFSTKFHLFPFLCLYVQLIHVLFINHLPKFKYPPLSLKGWCCSLFMLWIALLLILHFCSGKGKTVLGQTLNECRGWGSGVIVPLIFNLGTRWRYVAMSHPSHFTPRREIMVPVEQEAECTPEPVWLL
jgi:hypothetical protein